MTELEYLERREAAEIERIRRNLTGDDRLEDAGALIERQVRLRPWTTLGAAAALGGLTGVLLGRGSLGRLVALTRFARKPVGRFVRRQMGSR